ncbi:MAG: DUF4445 domain-containing protein [Deltaproteobacteria bacterium]|nr:DUF4445 domain-containing protein [Deltaproteobacteria bacterium]
MTKNYRIDFQPLGRRGECATGESVQECSLKAGVGMTNICGGKGKCRSCRLRVLKGCVSEPTSSERDFFSAQELEAGWRLGCQVYPLADCSVYVPPESMTTPQRTQVEGLEIRVQPDPPVLCYKVDLVAPDLSDLTADADRLLQGLLQKHGVACRKVDEAVLRSLSMDLRDSEWQCHVGVRSDEVISLRSLPGPNLGLAIDLGTTKIAGYLVDLENGKRLSSKGMMNPQISFGEDVITRIGEALRSLEKAAEIQKTVVEALNRLTRELCDEAGCVPEQILEAEVGCNTAMHHLLLGLPVKQLITAPYVPAASFAIELKTRDLGLNIAPGAYIHMLPNVAGFVGGDHVAMLLASEAFDRKELVLALDIGTNTEVSLINEGRIASVSCASGPAFEGYQIKYGMRAARGAIERVRINGNSVECATIDEAAPVGICGSGVLDAVAQMYLAGILDRGGRMIERHPRVRNVGGDRQFILCPDERPGEEGLVGITQKDIRQLQLAKAAIRAGIQVLLEASGRSGDEIEEVIIAGAFGTYIDVQSAVTAGMLPKLPLSRFRQVGNAAGMGAQMALISSAVRKEAENLALRIRYIELAGSPQFSKIFVRACYLGDYEEGKG